MLGRSTPLKGLVTISPLKSLPKKQESFNLGDDIHNLCDVPSVGMLGVIHEDSAGHTVDRRISIQKKVGTHGGLARLTTEEFKD